MSRSSSLPFLIAAAAAAAGCASATDHQRLPDAAPLDGAALDALQRLAGDGGSDGAAPDLRAHPDLGPVDLSQPDLRMPDVTPPGAIDSLAATSTGFTTVRLDWTAVGDDAAIGTANAYQVRYSTQGITSDALFTAATVASGAPTPAVAGTPQTMTVSGLTAGTTYYFAVRAVDEAGNTGALSNVPSATTLPRAHLLINEVAVSNAPGDGYDFVELVAITAGRTDGLVVSQLSGSLHTLGALTLAVGDRIVVHATGLPCPQGCDQEDVSGSLAGASSPLSSATAWDVYSSTVGVVGTDNTITVKDGTLLMDAVALSNRDGDLTSTARDAFAALRAGGDWAFVAVPDGSNDCDVQLDAAGVATAVYSCGGFPVSAPGRSLQRNGTFDTNSKRDFYWAAQTPGLANGPNLGPTVVAATAPTATEVRVQFDDELDPASVLPAGFAITGLTLNGASLFDLRTVSLLTTSQDPGAAYTVNVDATVTDLQSVGVGAPSSAPFNGFVPPDVTPPDAISTLVATAVGATSVRLDWNAVGDDGSVGQATSYDVRYSSSPITSDVLFAAATSVSGPPTPATPGSAETFTVTGLAPLTLYYFAVRASDEVPNAGAISNAQSATTLQRAQLLISEVAVANSVDDGYDFVELRATSAGYTDGLIVAQTSGALRTLGPLQVAPGDRVVVHASGLPCPTNCAQEDSAGGHLNDSQAPFASDSAWDLYSSSSGIVATNTAITLKDGATIMDAVVLSNRSGAVAASTRTAFATLAAANAWVFALSPADPANDCSTQRDSVSMATADSSCGGFAVMSPRRSAQRVATADTNTKADFYIADQSPGLANTANPAPTVRSAAATDSQHVLVRFDDDLDPTSVSMGEFSIAGLGITDASLSDVNAVLLSTASQPVGGNFIVVVTTAITDLQGTALATSSGVHFCGFGPAATAIINEVAPNQSGNKDLIELRVRSAGSLAGLTLHSNPTSPTGNGTTLATLPMICAALDDLVVVHLTPDPGPSSETLDKATQFPSGTYSQFYDGAWDVLGTTNPIPLSDVVLTLLAADNSMLDAVAFTNSKGAPSGAFSTALGVVQASGAWAPADCGGLSCELICADFSTANGITPADPTIARDASGTDTNKKADFTVGVTTMGSGNGT